MSLNEPDEQELIELYRQYRKTPGTSEKRAAEASVADAPSRILEDRNYSHEERAIIQDYRTFKRTRVEAPENQDELISSIVEKCAPILESNESAQQSQRSREVVQPTRPSLPERLAESFRNALNWLLAPQGALVATAIVAGVVLFPMLNSDDDHMMQFTGSDAFNEEFALASLSAHYPQSITRNSSLPGRHNLRAYHYHIGRMIAGLAIAIRGGNLKSGPVYASQLERLVADDADIEADRITHIQQFWKDHADGTSDIPMESLNVALELLVDNFNERKLTDLQRSFEHLGAWTMVSHTVVRAGLENASVDEDLLVRLVEDFNAIRPEILNTPDLLVKQRRSLTAFDSIVRDGGDSLSGIDPDRLLSISESLENIHIAFKN